MTKEEKHKGMRNNMPSTDLPPREFWNELYAQREQVWSGKVNATLAAEVEKLTPGSVLDLGCGEGGDVLWLAEMGWQATGIDISDLAIERARKRAKELGFEESQARFISQDLNSWDPTETFDLVVSSFLQSPVELERERILAAALQRVKPGGRFIALSHAGLPAWVEIDPDFHKFPDPAAEIKFLVPEGSADQVIFAGVVNRPLVGPEGQEGTIPDGLLVIQKG